jgi:CheY-like chemotaxis protein
MPEGMMSSNSPAQPLTLLVVAPNQEILNLVKVILSADRNCNRILLADNASDGFALAASERPDVILATCGKDETGLALCRRVRQDPALKTTPFVVLTTSSSHKTYTDYFARGCDQILPIPFRCSDIAMAIDNARKRNQGHAGGKIHVLLKSGRADFIAPPVLNRLLAANEVLCFRRKSGIAVVGQDPLRYGNRADYRGPERRVTMV